MLIATPSTTYTRGIRTYACAGITVQLQVQSPYENTLLGGIITNRDPFLISRGRLAIEYVCSASCNLITRYSRSTNK